MRMSGRVVLTIGMLGLFGCGGSEPENSTVADIEACLYNESAPGAEVTSKKGDLDLIAEAAGDGGVAVHWSKNEVNIAVERSSSDAEQRRTTKSSPATTLGTGSSKRARS